MSIEVQDETPEHRAQREAITARMESELRAAIAKHAVPPSPDLCACGHGRAMHFDEDGDHNGPCLWQVHKDAPFCKCDMWHRKPSEDEFLGVPVSEWRQIAAEINCRRGPDGSMLKRFRELLEVSDMRAALLKKRSAPSPSPALAEQLIDAAKHIDWKQVGLNGGGCFHLEEDGRFCLRAHHWAGHGGEKPVHLYEPLYVAMTRIAKASDSSPALAEIVAAGDAMRELVGEYVGDKNDTLNNWDRARAALPKDGAR